MNTHLKLALLAALSAAAFIGGAVAAMRPAKAADLGGFDFRYQSERGDTTYGTLREDGRDGYGYRYGDQRRYDTPYGTRRDGWRDHGRHAVRVEADGSFSDQSLPQNVQEWRAQRIAIMAWREKVRDQYGPDYSRWRAATEKSVDCHRRYSGVVCQVSAVPAQGNGWGGWGRGWTEEAARYGERDVE